MHGTRFDPTPQMEQVRNPNGPRIQRDDHRVMCDTCLPSAAAFAAKDISILLLIIPSSLSFLYLGLLPVIFIFYFFVDLSCLRNTHRDDVIPYQEQELTFLGNIRKNNTIIC